MDLQIKLAALQESQKQILQEYEAVVKEYQATDVLQQNVLLRQEIGDCKVLIEQLEQKGQVMSAENQHLRIALRDQIADEKLNILKISREKLATYFQAQTAAYENGLTAAEAELRHELQNLQSAAERNLDETKDVYKVKLQSLAEELYISIQALREQFAMAKQNLFANVETRFADLAAGEISEAQMQRRIKQNEIEMLVGLNWVNKIGIFLILLGVGAAAKYTYVTWFNAHLKGMSFFLLGGLLLACGEWFYRKTKDVFASGLIGGGISVLYCATFYSYFLLKTIELNTGLVLSLLVTLVAVVLSVRYKSQTVCALGLVGGYLPFFTYISTFGLAGGDHYVAMGYLLLLNMSVLLVSFRQQWHIINYISFVCHIPSLVYVVFEAPSTAVGITYAAVAFPLYTAIILAYPFKHHISLKKADVILLGLNTFFSCLVLYLLLEKAGLHSYKGLLALSFCLIYTGLGKFTDRYLPDEKYANLVLYSAALTFAVLMVPFQLGVKWISMGWLVESLILIIYGCRKRLSQLEKAGWIIFALCLTAFYLRDYPDLHTKHEVFIRWKYSFVIIGMVGVMLTYLQDLKAQGVSRYGRMVEKIALFKNFTLVNLWLYLLSMSSWLLKDVIPRNGILHSFYDWLIIAVVTIAFGYATLRIPIIYDRFVRYFSGSLFLLGALICAGVNTLLPVWPSMGSSTTGHLAFVILCIFNILVLLCVRELLVAVIKGKYLNLEYYPLCMSVYLLGTATGFLSVQFRLQDTHLLFSFTYLMIAIGSIWYGFNKRYIYIRQFGLGLAFLATTKLFIYDLAYLTALYKILAYFCFGLVLLGISFMYQKLKNSREGQNFEQNM